MRKTTISLFLLLLLQVALFAQSKNDPTKDEQKPTSLEETLTLSVIERAEAKQKKLMDSAEELNSLAQDLFKSARGQSQISGENQKKLAKIEKLAKHVRSEQGGENGDDNLENPPQNLETALDRLQKATEEIEKETGKLTRHAVSIVLIERTNEVIALTKTIKKMGSK